MTKKIFYCVGATIFIICWIWGIISIMNVPSEVKIYHKPKSMGSRVEVYIGEDNLIYTCSIVRPAIQVYDINGEFLYGVDIPHSGGYQPIYKDGTLYINNINFHYYYAIHNGEITEMDDVDFDTEPTFHIIYWSQNSKYRIQSLYLHRILIKDLETNKYRVIKLKNTPTRITIFETILVAFIGVLIILLPMYFWKQTQDFLKKMGLKNLE